MNDRTHLPWLLLFSLVTSAGAIPVEVIEAKLRDIRFVSFEVNNVTLADCLQELERKTEEATAQDVPPRNHRLEFILVPPESVPSGSTNHPALTVSYQGKGVTLDTVLREIGKTANQDVFLTSAGVVITPVGIPPFPNPEEEKGEIFRKLTGDGKD